ncbi:hypothetical protein SAMN05421810_107172 [Amycolatopsis arida]|uniref:Uncharacterized protein n=1 Tax=Amycolatopsis arida TaxID=587909 RepID=A0A1I5YHX5_9PSEU|nr:hypothetical protein [Amycolatopsis arida]TDX90526.1 hypothetical protein CLV69_107172 [Amycolatopsis arida]SFQ43766.1 hypothetical protein SAMN05421810_107172 [Amycolatopsis arida]
MSITTRLLAYLLALVAVFGVTWAVGAAVGPLGRTTGTVSPAPEAPMETVHDEHGDGHGTGRSEG